MEPNLKKKKLIDYVKKQYIYNAILFLLTIVGISYGAWFFISNKNMATGVLNTKEVTIETNDLETIKISDQTGVTDEEGLNTIPETITIKNTSNTDLKITVNLNHDDGSTLTVNNLRYSTYLNNYEIVAPNSLETSTIVYNGLLLKGETIELDIYLWIKSDYQETDKTFSGNFDIDVLPADMLGADYLEQSVNKNNGLISINNEYHYSGTNTNNYIWFNCQDGTTSGSENCELWRIVGVFNVKGNEYQNTYQRIKLVRDENILNQAFGGTSYNTSTINTYLNNDYYNSLNNSAKKMILTSEWNIGTTSLNNTASASLTSENTTKYYAKVGLLSVSDIGYSNSDQTLTLNNTNLLANSWLNGKSFYTINSDGTNIITSNGTNLTTTDNTTSYGIKPSIYLSPTVSIINGNGTSEKPFELNYLEIEEQYDKIPVLGYITYDTTGYDVTTPEKQPIYADGTTTITTAINNTVIENFVGWSIEKDGEVVYKPGDKINTNDIANGKITLYPVVVNYLINKIENTLALTESDTDGTRYVYGETENNYVWYSGKLWRIVGLNSDGTIKLVTQNAMTAVAWDLTSTNTDYSTSQIRSWLNNEFLPTINQDLIVESTWDYTTYESFPTTRLTPTNTVTDKVGLLTVYDFAMTGGTNSSSTTKSFLKNGYYWWTMSPRMSGSLVWYVDYNGYASNYSPTNSRGARPSVNLKSGIQIVDNGATGTKENPYMLKGDYETGKTNDSLNTRISGEYIKFNNVLYRIVGTEEVNGNLLTKVTMADYSVNSNTIGSVAFGASTSELTFSSTYGIGLYLENWYQAASSSETYASTYINDTYKSMIATADDGVVWYTGPDGGIEYDYTLAKTGTSISATIGLGRYGEMFSSQFGDGYSSSTDTWLMTKYSGSYVWYMLSGGYAHFYGPTASYGARPSFYLKSDVKITSGTGLSNDPYEIEYDANLYETIESKFSGSLTEKNSDGVRYIAGTSDEITDNYVWYSGKLWRIVGLNSDGTIKLVTQNAMTAVAWDPTSTNTDYSTSQIRSWLKSEFLPTIQENLIVESAWDYTTDGTADTTKPTTTSTVTDKVGLLTIYEYYMAGGSSSFLKNGYYWWTMSPKTSGSGVWGVNNNGEAPDASPTNRYEVRPSVILKSDIQLVDNGATGTKDNPYQLVGDYETGQTNDRLNTRISGEYIKFNNVLYRIVGTEEVNGNLLTKVTMADYSVNSNTIGTVTFGASASELTFSPTSGIGLYLENWYQADSSSETYASTYINNTYKSMIATKDQGVVWYTGPDGGTEYDYTLAKTGTSISATIGLGRYGEMFSSQFGDGSSSSTSVWLMTKYSSSYDWYVSNNGYAYHSSPTESHGVHPSFYLKSDVKISSGSGLYSEPYEIS